MDWLSKIIEKFVDRYFEQKAVPKYLSGIENLIRANHKESAKRFPPPFFFNYIILPLANKYI